MRNAIIENFNVIVLGTGAAGRTAAIAAHESGIRVRGFETSDKVGGTLGPGMVFGYHAGRHAARRNATS